MPSSKCLYVRIPADISEPIKELTLVMPEGKEVEQLTVVLQKHYANQGSLDSAAKQAYKKSILDQMKAQGKSVANVDDSVMDMLVSREAVEIVSLLPSRPDNKFVGVNMYCDDRGLPKRLPVNMRASGITRTCGKPTQVYGDAFFGRVLDDGRDLFERQDFGLKDVDSDALWIKQAIEFYRTHKPGDGAQQMEMLKQAQAMKPLSQAKKDDFKTRLESWVQGKLKEYDNNETFKNSRDKKHGNREGFEKSLRAKAEKQYQKELAGR